jgi:uncharacterized membrane protein
VTAAAEPHRASHHGAFGSDSFGRFAENVAHFFGTPQYIVGRTIVVICWIVFNTAALGGVVRFDPEPYILLNLIFSTQAAYAAPLILLAQTRQADRDKISEDTAERRHNKVEHQIEGETDRLLELLQANTQLTTQDKDLTEQVAQLTREIHALICKPGEPAAS